MSSKVHSSGTGGRKGGRGGPSKKLPADKVDTPETCPGCGREYNKHRHGGYEKRPKMRSIKCGHILCEDCVDSVHGLGESKCTVSTCKVRLKSSDWEKWVPPAPPRPAGLALGEVPNIPFPTDTREQVEERRRQLEYEEGGLFCTPGPGTPDPEQDEQGEDEDGTAENPIKIEPPSSSDDE